MPSWPACSKPWWQPPWDCAWQFRPWSRSIYCSGAYARPTRRLTRWHIWCFPASAANEARSPWHLRQGDPMAGKVASSYDDDEAGTMSDINVTPLVDVTLVLLIVFMITIPA